MAQTPLNDMADTGYENMSEESGYILHELKLQMRGLTRRIEDAATKSALQAVWKSVENGFADKRTFDDLAKFVSKLAEQSPQLEDLRKSLNILASDQDLHKIYRAVTTIASADVLALNATPQEIVPAPGANKYVDIVHAELFLDYNSAAYAVDAGEDISLEYTTAGQIIQFTSAGFLDQTSDQRRAGGPTVDVPIGLDEAVQLTILSGEVLTGDSDLKVRVDYRILDSLI